MSKKAIAIRLNKGCTSPKSCNDISEIKIYDELWGTTGWKSKADVYDMVTDSPKSIKVNRDPYPYLIPVKSIKNEKYVRSEPNDTVHDNLLELSQE